ncbi:MAG: hypothetical protein O2794_00405 [bacterium]|nr:hypothetical protein [bacterium]
MIRIVVFTIILAAILTAHSYIVDHNLYNEIWWLDMVLHSLGGLLASSVFVTFLRPKNYWPLFGFIFLVAAAWELLEFFIDVPFFGGGPIRLSDPIWALDMLSDMAIALSASFLLWLAYCLYNKSNV